jgi:tRNA(Arg) A34 adenosine deaminase TadA
MWDTISFPWQVCIEEAWTAYCSGSMPIGAVVVDANGAITGRGRNRIMDEMPDGALASQNIPTNPLTVVHHELAHAELNALLSFQFPDSNDTSHGDLRQWALYTLIEPCPLCMGAFYMSGLRNLYYAARDPHAGSVNMLGTTPYLSHKPIQVFGPSDNLEPISIALSVDAVLQDSSAERSEFLLAAWRKASPRGVSLGERLYEKQVLKGLWAAGATALEMIGQVIHVMESIRV